jgi:hypothetical protein
MAYIWLLVEETTQNGVLAAPFEPKVSSHTSWETIAAKLTLAEQKLVKGALVNSSLLQLMPEIVLDQAIAPPVISFWDAYDFIATVISTIGYCHPTSFLASCSLYTDQPTFTALAPSTDMGTSSLALTMERL